MEKEMNSMIENIEGFRLPRYGQIPNVGLYLEQVVRYVNAHLAPLGGIGVDKLHGEQLCETGSDPIPDKEGIHGGTPRTTPVHCRSQARCPA